MDSKSIVRFVRPWVQIPPTPPHRRHKLYIACDDFFAKNHPALTPLFLLSPKSLTTFRGPHKIVIKPISGFFLFFKS